MACDVKVARQQRRRVCSGLAGEVVEIGFGSGLNIPFYPAAVERVAAVEPADVRWKLAGKRLRETSVRVERAGLDGQALPFADDAFDAALSTWTMCTIADVGAAQPIQKRLFGGCRLTRPTVPLLRDAGFEIRDVDPYHENGSPKFLGANSLGVAVSP